MCRHWLIFTATLLAAVLAASSAYGEPCIGERVASQQELLALTKSVSFESLRAQIYTLKEGIKDPLNRTKAFERAYLPLIVRLPYAVVRPILLDALADVKKSELQPGDRFDRLENIAMAFAQREPLQTVKPLLEEMEQLVWDNSKKGMLWGKSSGEPEGQALASIVTDYVFAGDLVDARTLAKRMSDAKLDGAPSEFQLQILEAEAQFWVKKDLPTARSQFEHIIASKADDLIKLTAYEMLLQVKHKLGEDISADADQFVDFTRNIKSDFFSRWEMLSSGANVLFEVGARSQGLALMKDAERLVPKTQRPNITDEIDALVSLAKVYSSYSFPEDASRLLAKARALVGAQGRVLNDADTQNQVVEIGAMLAFAGDIASADELAKALTGGYPEFAIHAAIADRYLKVGEFDKACQTSRAIIDALIDGQWGLQDLDIVGVPASINLLSELAIQRAKHGSPKLAVEDLAAALAIANSKRDDGDWLEAGWLGTIAVASYKVENPSAHGRLGTFNRN